MKDLLVLLVQLLTTVAKLLGSGGAKAVVANSLIMKQQLLVNDRSRRRSPNLLPLDRFLLGFWSLFLSPHRLLPTAIVIRPPTLLEFHDALVKPKYRLLFSSIRRGKPGPKGLSQELIQAIGDHIVTIFFKYPLQHELEFATDSHIKRLIELRCK